MSNSFTFTGVFDLEEGLEGEGDEDDDDDDEAILSLGSSFVSLVPDGFVGLGMELRVGWVCVRMCVCCASVCSLRESRRDVARVCLDRLIKKARGS